MARLWNSKTGQGLSSWGKITAVEHGLARVCPPPQLATEIWECRTGWQQLAMEFWRGRASTGGRGIDKEKHMVWVSGYVPSWQQMETTGRCLASNSVDCFLIISCYRLRRNIKKLLVVFWRLLVTSADSGTGHFLWLLWSQNNRQGLAVSSG